MDYVRKAAEGRKLIEQAIVEALSGTETGYYNSELARLLDLESDYEGRHDNYLTYSVLGGLLKRGVVAAEKRGNRIYYTLVAT